MLRYVTATHTHNREKVIGYVFESEMVDMNHVKSSSRQAAEEVSPKLDSALHAWYIMVT